MRPDRTGAVNAKGLAFYDRLADALLARGIEPLCTLFRWDFPQALEDRFGGWTSRHVSQALADDAGVVARRLSDLVHHFFTTNEFVCFIDQGYGSGIQGAREAPARGGGRRHGHYALLGDGLAVQAVRAAARPGVRVGLAENSNICVPVIETPEHIRAAQQAMRSALPGSSNRAPIRGWRRTG